MNEQDAINQMISPGMRRKNIWREGVLQIWITRGCDLACFGCTQGSNLGGKPGRITLEQFKAAVESLQGYFGVVGIFGGNPAIHPQFNAICETLAANVPYEQRGLWCNHPRGNTAVMRATFNPAVSNLNVHLVREAYDEFVEGWPECKPYLKGLDPSWVESEALRRKGSKEYAHRVGDARHTPPFVAMSDLDQLPFPDGRVLPNTEENRWELIAGCDINKHWSAMICVFRDQLRAFFCEIAASQAMLHQAEPDYPDTGLPVEPGWWQRPMQDFAAQARKHCHECGIPIRSFGELAIGGQTEKVSQAHAAVFTPKRLRHKVELVQLSSQLVERVGRVTDYIENGER
jgi:hypothetical protein